MKHAILKRDEFQIDMEITLPGRKPSQDSLESAMEAALIDVLAMENCTLWQKPDFQIQSDQAEAFVFSAKVKVLPAIRLPDPETLVVARPGLDLPEELHLFSRLAELLRQHAQLKAMPQPATWGNQIKLSLQATVQGSPVPGHFFEQTDLLLRKDSETLLATIAQQLVGLKAGESKKGSFTIPADYPFPAWRGQTGQFQAKLLAVAVVKYPALDAAFARKTGLAQNLSGLEEALEQKLSEDIQAEFAHRIYLAIYQEISRQIRIPLPPELIESKLKELWQLAEPLLHHKPLPAAQAEKAFQVWRELNRELEAEVGENLRQGLILKTAIEQFSLDLTQAELNQALEALAARFGFTLEQAWAHLQEQDLLISFQQRILQEKAEKYLASRVQFRPDP